jgi:hypothetical protein
LALRGVSPPVLDFALPEEFHPQLWILPFLSRSLPLTFLTKSKYSENKIKIKSCISFCELKLKIHENAPKFHSLHDHTQTTGDETATIRVKLGPKDSVTLQIITVH